MSERPAALGRLLAEIPLLPLLKASPEDTIAETARRMAGANVESAITLDAEGRPAGILTDSDLRRRVLAGAADPAAPLAGVLSSPVITIRRDAAAYEAVVLMLERKIGHLVVVDEHGRALATLTHADLLGLESAGPVALVRRIESSSTIEELAAARASYHVTLRALLASGAGARTILAILAEANDRVQRRLLALAAAELGPAPCPFAWIVMGSEGRRTQTLRTDQDNGIVWSDERCDGEHFTALGEWMVDALERTGLERCRGGVMATNPLWRGPLSRWTDRFAGWLRDPEPAALLRSLIAFDFRAVAGEDALADRLRDWVVERTPAARLLLVHVAREALRRSPPLGPLGRLRLSRDGSFDAKLEAIGILVDTARLFALELGLRTTSTMDRLAEAGARGAIPAEDASEAAAAYDALQMVRLRRQAAAAAAGHEPDNRIVPRELGRAERAALREHLAAIGRLQTGIADRYGSAATIG